MLCLPKKKKKLNKARQFNTLTPSKYYLVLGSYIFNSIPLNLSEGYTATLTHRSPMTNIN